MNAVSIVAAIDAEIARLQQARSILARVGTGALEKPAVKRRPLSEEARARIAAAQRRRWAKARRA